MEGKGALQLILPVYSSVSSGSQLVYLPRFHMIQVIIVTSLFSVSDSEFYKQYTEI
jgi:hypothetical protein